MHTWEPIQLLSNDAWIPLMIIILWKILQLENQIGEASATFVFKQMNIDLMDNYVSYILVHFISFFIVMNIICLGTSLCELYNCECS
jgi:hypothetical protein